MVNVKKVLEERSVSIVAKFARISRRLALYNEAMNTLEDYFEYRSHSAEDREYVYATLEKLATNLRETDNDQPTDD